MVKLTFLGAAQTVTGSKFLVETPTAKVLVDCGLFQGLKALRLQNRQDLPIDPSSIDAVILTHAHLDHSGYVPALVKAGFCGPVYCTPATRDLAALLLPDAGYLQEEEARYANLHHTSKHSPALPLFTAADAQRCLKYFQCIDFNTTTQITPTISVKFSRAGHILGAACVHLQIDGRSIVFSGDVGRPNDAIMAAPEPLGDVDFLVLESTYGNRRHKTLDARELLKKVVLRAIAEKGVVLIPAFAVGRAQLVLHLLAEMHRAGDIADIPIFLNSPMAINATQIFFNYANEHRLTQEQCTAMHASTRFVREADASRALTQKAGPAVIVSASGMASGGRVLHHLKALAPHSKNTILFIGYQAAGTRGESILAGASEVKIHGEYVPIRADVQHLDNLSAHADYAELIDWLRSVPKPPQQTFIVHGEPSPADALRVRLKDALGWTCLIPEPHQSVTLWH